MYYNTVKLVWLRLSGLSYPILPPSPLPAPPPEIDGQGQAKMYLVGGGERVQQLN